MAIEFHNHEEAVVLIEEAVSVQLEEVKRRVIKHAVDMIRGFNGRCTKADIRLTVGLAFIANVRTCIDGIGSALIDLMSASYEMRDALLAVKAEKEAEERAAKEAAERQ